MMNRYWGFVCLFWLFVCFCFYLGWFATLCLGKQTCQKQLALMCLCKVCDTMSRDISSVMCSIDKRNSRQPPCSVFNTSMKRNRILFLGSLPEVFFAGLLRGSSVNLISTVSLWIAFLFFKL